MLVVTIFVVYFWAREKDSLQWILNPLPPNRYFWYSSFSNKILFPHLYPFLRPPILVPTFMKRSQCEVGPQSQKLLASAIGKEAIENITTTSLRDPR